MYEHGCISRKGLEKRFHMIDSKFGFELWENNFYDEDVVIIVDTENNVYTYTCESIDYMIDNKDEYTWNEFKPIG